MITFILSPMFFGKRGHFFEDGISSSKGNQGLLQERKKMDNEEKKLADAYDRDC